MKPSLVLALLEVVAQRTSGLVPTHPSWSSVGLHPLVEEKLVGAGLAAPTGIQCASIPRILAGESVVISAETGCGKTLAYALGPVSEKRPTVVVAPSQALCAQIRGVLRGLDLLGSQDDDDSERRVEALLGVLDGAPRCAVVTPKDALAALGRVASGEVPAPSFSGDETSRLCVVLDEADALLKTPGKYASVKARRTPPGERVAEALLGFGGGHAQLVAASATVGRPLRRHLERLAARPVAVVRCSDNEVGTHRAVTAPSAIARHYVAPYEETNATEWPSYLALGALCTALRAARPRRCLVALANPDADARRTLFALRRAGFSNANDLLDYRDDERELLLVAPLRQVRGMDVPKLDLVIILERPRTPDDYLHAAGRAGRLGYPGLAVTLASHGDARVLQSWGTQLDLSFDRLPGPADLPPIGGGRVKQPRSASSSGGAAAGTAAAAQQS